MSDYWLCDHSLFFHFFSIFLDVETGYDSGSPEDLCPTSTSISTTTNVYEQPKIKNKKLHKSDKQSNFSFNSVIDFCNFLFFILGCSIIFVIVEVDVEVG